MWADARLVRLEKDLGVTAAIEYKSDVHVGLGQGQPEGLAGRPRVPLDKDVVPRIVNAAQLLHAREQRQMQPCPERVQVCKQVQEGVGLTQGAIRVYLLRGFALALMLVGDEWW